MKSAEELNRLQKAVAQHVISDEKVRELVMSEMEYNAKLLKDGEDGIVPRLIIYSKKHADAPVEQTVCMLVGMPEDTAKHKMIEEIGFKMATGEQKINPIAVTMCSEIWMKKIDKKDKEAYDKADKAVREYDDKTEGIMVSACTIDRRELAAVIEVSRDKKNKFIPGKVTFMDNVEAYILRRFYIGFTKGLMFNKEI